MDINDMEQLLLKLVSPKYLFDDKREFVVFKKLIVIFLSVCSLAAWTKSVSADVCANVSDQAGASYSLSWSTVSLGSGLGATGFSRFDSDGDGRLEILFGTGAGFGGNTSFAVAEFDDVNADYAVLCQSTTYSSDISKITPFQNDTIAHGSLIALSDGTVEVIDHSLGLRAQKIATGISQINDIAVADIDNDGSADIAVLSSTAINLYDANTYAYKQSIPYGATRFTTGQFTDGTGVEVALNNGYVLELIDTTITVLWDYTSIGFSNYFVESGDIDNDGLDEIVAADAWYNVRAFNADTQGILWEHTADLDVDALGVFDSSGDGIPEVVYGDGQWGSVYGLDGSTGTQIWFVNNPEHGVTDVLVANLDNDTEIELLWGAGYSSTGADYLFVHDLGTDTREWQSGESSGPYYGIDYGDLDGDGIPDRVYASVESESGYGDGIVTAVKGGTDAILWQTTANTFGGFAWTGVHDVAVADIDGDGINEVIVGTDRLYDGTVYILNSADGSVKTSITLEDGSPIYSVRVVDIDGDGDMEILAGGGKEHTGANGVYVYVIDGSTATWVSTFPSLGLNWTDLWSIEPVDIDNDGTTEIVALWGNTYIIDPDNNGLTATVDAYNSVASSLDVFTGDNIVYLGGPAGAIYTLAADGSTESLATVCSGAVTALETISPVMLAFTCDGRLATYDIVGSTVEWQVGSVIDDNLGMHDRLVYESISGVNTLMIGGNRVYYFTEVSPGSITIPTAYDDGFVGHFNQTISGVLTADDPSSSPLTYGLYQQPISGSVNIINTSTGEFVYTPTGDFSGTVNFQFYVSNGSEASNLATVTLTLDNTIPTGVQGTHDVHWNSLYLAILDGSDADGDAVQFEIITQPSQGVLVLLDELSGEFSYYNTSPVLDVVSFSYRLSDGADWSQIYTVILNLTNTAPVATVVNLETYYTVDISTFVAASDVDGDSLTYEIVNAPTVGTASLTSTGLLTYGPEGSASYNAVISYRVNDGKVWSTPGEIVINVVGVAVEDKSGGGGSISLWMLMLVMVNLLYSGFVKTGIYKRK